MIRIMYLWEKKKKTIILTINGEEKKNNVMQFLARCACLHLHIII